jgi:hypothetical protein
MAWLVLHATCQENAILLEDKESLVAYTDSDYGSDDMLINGRIYVPLHSLAEGHPYFQTIDWILGHVFVRGKTFEDVKLKFDIELDEFILYIEDKYGRKNYLVLNHHYVDSVAMGKYLFVNTATLPEVGRDIGYAERVYNSDLIFLVKYNKDFKKQYSESKPYGEYSKQNSDRYIAERGRLVKVTTRNSFLNYFEAHKKELKRYMKKQKINYKKANSGELHNLLNYCHALRTN